jgi:hypothetical protein
VVGCIAILERSYSRAEPVHCSRRGRSVTSFFANLTPEGAREALQSVGLSCAPGEVHITARDERWVVVLPREHIAWFPASESGSRRLTVEWRVPRLLADCCSFRVPRLLAVSESAFDAHRMVPGRCDPWAPFQRRQADPALAQKIGRSIGGIPADQDTAILEAEITGWLPGCVAWPESGDWIHGRLSPVVDDGDLLEMMACAIDSYDALTVDPKDSAAWADRHHDFRYLLFDVEREDMLDAALDVYVPLVGRSIDRDRVRLYNAVCSISYLAFRSGTPAAARSCGRTLAEDLRWMRVALARIQGPSMPGRLSRLAVGDGGAGSVA